MITLNKKISRLFKQKISPGKEKGRLDSKRSRL